jgi:hypothetical protein
MRLLTVGEETGHHVGDPQCPECVEEYPERCRCQGLIHAAEGMEDEGGEVLIVTKCDVCGRSEEELAEP